MLGNTQQKGLTTELHCIFDMTMLGYQCLKPISDSCKYDIAVDLGKRIIRIQCKSSKWATDTTKECVAFEIPTCYFSINTKRAIRYKYDENDIDYFYTWFNGQGYLVSIQEANGTMFRWRYTYPISGQKKNIHIADDYKVNNVISYILGKDAGVAQR